MKSPGPVAIYINRDNSMPYQIQDAVIVGGGPAGSSCARLLQKQGLQTLIIDKQQFPRDKTCAGWITPAVIQSLELDLDDYAKHNILQPLYGFEISMLGEKKVRVDYARPMSYGIRRFEFDNYLIKRANTPILDNTEVKHIKRENGLWTINDEIQTPLLIGAGGHFCPVARKLGAKLGQSEPAIVAQEVEFEMSAQQQKNCKISSEVPELYFCRDLKGYGWVFRKGAYLNIGLGRQDQHQLNDHVNQFFEELQNNGRIPVEIKEKKCGHAYLLYGFTARKIVAEGALLIGDSAGLAYAQSGEGIRPAIDSAILAAETIKQCKTNYSEASLNHYLNAISTRFGRRNKNTNLKLASLLPAWLKQKIAARILANNWFSRNYVLNKWFFHLQQKPLLYQNK